MKRISKKEQWRLLVERWKNAGPELERIHREELRAYKYNPRDADALLAVSDSYQGHPGESDGLVEMQRLFMEMARRQGLLPTEAREGEAPYDAAPAKKGTRKKKA